MSKVAVCYWGLTRSTKKVYQSHYENIFNILQANNIVYHVFIHSWETNNNLIWEEKSDKPIDYEEYKLLKPSYYVLDNQTDFLSSINFSNYFDKKLYDTYGDTEQTEWRPLLIQNHLCALESLKRVTAMVMNSKDNSCYDKIMYVRPDVNITSPIDISWLNMNKGEICIADFDHCEGYNDRFAIMNMDDCQKYSNRIDNIIEYRRTIGRIVSEKYLKYTIDRQFTTVHFIPFYFQIIRP